MPILFGAHILVALLCAVHVVKTGRAMYWLMILFIFPGLGSAVYVIAEILPDVFGSSTARKAGTAARKALDPGREAREALTQLEISRTPGNLMRAAHALLAIGKMGDALILAEEAASGPFAEDSAIMFTLAQAQFANERYEEARLQLEAMKAAQPDLRHPEGHLLYARTLEALGRVEDALETYEQAASYYPGPEARARWAMLLEQQGARESARLRWQEILTGAKHAPGFVRKTHRKWLDMARSRS
ncbi:CDC27 family protein [Maricaulis parjimensis]|uniref:CDC27 family protein n=1 Tax=Maricaulis parjimensis TaxID=144023 RepID=UPI00193969A2|nr:CDC27 family protein [Maricaulis parjimensis]